MTFGEIAYQLRTQTLVCLSDAPPPELGPHPPGAGASPAASFLVREDGSTTGSTGDLQLDTAVAGAARKLLARGGSRTVVVGDRQVFLEGYPATPRPGEVER